jgi:dihydroflavonol-4-reductase
MVHPEAKGQRFIATSDGVVSFYDIARLIKKERPKKAARVADMKPIGSEFYINISNRKAREILQWHPGSKEEAILASLDSPGNE